MKSKKIIAMIVAFAAFMAVATSGFAAVTTTTTYNQVADKVVVDVDVTEATPDSEVTYLVKASNGDIVYIDQKTADASGNVGFDYKIAKNKISDLVTDVKFGTNGAAAITDTTALALANVDVTVDANATIAFYSDAACQNLIGDAAVVGNSDVIYAKVTVANGYEIDAVNGLEATADDSVYKVTGNAVSVTTKSTYVPPSVAEPEQEELKAVISENVKADNGQGEEVDAVAFTKVLKVVGQPTEVGIVYDGVEYKALKNGDNYDNNTLYAVRLIFADGTVITEFDTYCK